MTTVDTGDSTTVILATAPLMMCNFDSSMFTLSLGASPIHLHPMTDNVQDYINKLSLVKAVCDRIYELVRLQYDINALHPPPTTHFRHWLEPDKPLGATISEGSFSTGMVAGSVSYFYDRVEWELRISDCQRTYRICRQVVPPWMQIELNKDLPADDPGIEKPMTERQWMGQPKLLVDLSSCLDMAIHNLQR